MLFANSWEVWHYFASTDSAPFQINQVAGKRIKQLDLKKCNIGVELETQIDRLLMARKFDEEDLLNPA
jgi:hypothetical protein